MLRTARILGATVAAICSAILLLGTATPAQAQDALECTAYQTKFMPQGNGAITVSVQTCVERYGNTHKAAVAHAEVHVTNNYNPPTIAKQMTVTAQLKHYGVVLSSVTCHWRSIVNHLGVTFPPNCTPRALTGGTPGGWTADGYIVWDLDADSNPARTWNLAGSKALN